MSIRLRFLVLSAFFGAAAASAGAQSLANGSNAQCTDAAAPSDLRRATGYLRADAADSAPAFVPVANNFLEILGRRVRAMLNAKREKLPVAEPTFTRSSVDGRLLVTLYRDGRKRLTIQPDTSDRDSLRVGGIRALFSLAQTAADDGDRVEWPDFARGDSAQFRIGFDIPSPRKNGSLLPADSGFTVPVFSIAVPWAEPASAASRIAPRYPPRNLSSHVEGIVRVRFVIDTTGRAMMSTARDFLPRGYAVPVGAQAAYYRDFVEAGIAIVSTARFNPAVIAGCRTPQLVDLPFEFRIR